MLKLSYLYFRDSQAGTNTVSEPIKNNQLELFSKS